MEDLFIQHVWAPGCCVRELVCLWQQAGGALGSPSPPPVRLYPRRLSQTGLKAAATRLDGLGINCSLSSRIMREHTNKQPHGYSGCVTRAHTCRYAPHPQIRKAVAGPDGWTCMPASRYARLGLCALSKLVLLVIHVYSLEWETLIHQMAAS